MKIAGPYRVDQSKEKKHSKLQGDTKSLYKYETHAVTVLARRQTSHMCTVF